MQVVTRAVVRTWHDDQGWGVLDSAATPGGCWCHFSAVDVDGYRRLVPGQQVRLTASSPGQDGYDWTASRVEVDGGAPGAPSLDSSGAYGSSLAFLPDPLPEDGERL